MHFDGRSTNHGAFRRDRPETDAGQNAESDVARNDRLFHTQEVTGSIPVGSTRRFSSDLMLP